MKRVGWPTKVSPQVQRKILYAIRMGAPLVGGAAPGISFETFRTWRGAGQADTPATVQPPGRFGAFGAAVREAEFNWELSGLAWRRFYRASPPALSPDRRSGS